MRLKIIDTIGNNKIATVYIAKTPENKYLEFVESIQPPLSRQDKWVLVISVLFGCPVGCLMCDAGNAFAGKLSQEEIFAQIDYLVNLHYPQKPIDSCKFKIQFARVGEPTFNPALLEVLNELPERYKCKGLFPSFSTVAPTGCDDFLAKLREIKNTLYPHGKFQMQFSVHTTDEKLRDKIIPADKWNFAKIVNYCEKFYAAGDKKITLNFALAKNFPFEVTTLKNYFSPSLFIIKITPINPTVTAINNNIASYFTIGTVDEDKNNLIAKLHDADYEVILSIGELEENQIGSNCGQYVQKFTSNKNTVLDRKAYSYVKNILY